MKKLSLNAKKIPKWTIDGLIKLKVNPEGLAWLKKTEPGEYQDKPGMKTWIKKPGTR